MSARTKHSALALLQHRRPLRVANLAAAVAVARAVGVRVDDTFVLCGARAGRL